MSLPYVRYPIPYPPLDYEKQSVEVPGTKRAGQTGHYRNASQAFVDLNYAETIHNAQEAFENGLAIAGPDAPCLGQRRLISKNPVQWSPDFEWQSYGTVNSRRHALGSGLAKLFHDGVIGGGPLQTVGIWSKNTANWKLIDLSLELYNLVSVALYDTLGQDSVEYVINHAETSIIFASTQNIPTLLKIAARTPCLKVIVAMDEVSEGAQSVLTSWAQSQSIKFMSLNEVEILGSKNPIKPPSASSSAIATICYTSGTTGTPKGALLTQGSLALSARNNMSGGDYADQPAVLLSYLPLAHVFERIMEMLTITFGGAIGYGTGDPLRLMEDLQILRPSIFPSVPRVLNRIVSAVMAASNAGGFKGAMFNKALNVKMANYRKDGTVKHALWDRLVFSKVQAILGGRICFVGVGSAPMNAASIDFLRHLIYKTHETFQGYGATETGGSATRTYPNDKLAAGTVGAPAISVEIKLVDVPALGYTSEDKPNPRGEICMRGVPLFKGYFKNEEATKACLDEEGWYHSGDVGELDSQGRFRIIDRVKNIMKLSQGEYVALERIESLYSASPIAAQLYVHGDSLQSYLVAVLVPDLVQLASIASAVSATAVTPDDHAGLSKALNDEKVVRRLMAELEKEGEKNNLKGFEKIKRVHLSLKPFTVEEGTLTPTLKIRRKDAYLKFKNEIESMYTVESSTRSQL
ncbi:acetyl-CoA synthetase-like protein [Cristinia sonorae]|uniref:Acetyl-CoA synthetase-like protein n=1 Tax=Cristinia sonorae TaxID=1940300 RepID=A0A8K0XRU8_9AGAR|nr:acetyl-CoA synthetase-like protein [Cristinia sonorae]